MMKMPDGKVVGPFSVTPEQHKAQGDAMIAAMVGNLNAGASESSLDQSKISAASPPLALLGR